ncbi:efflux transporter outer membrane subunit [Pseudochelatococcus sp. G4_1912]|uniref:efflux transporter outer membrane subunit n=1 Tax=Pseudochelatococcus sp. G4_1912 TaxID=3114288 RepID=UPI0039C7434B
MIIHAGMSRAHNRPRATRVILSLALTVFLSACAVGPEYATPNLPIPARWSNESAQKAPKPADLAHWWTRLRDPTLNSIIERAVAGNLDVATAKARVREARASYDQTIGSLFPSIDGTASATRSKGAGQSTTQSSGGTTSTSFTNSSFGSGIYTNRVQAGLVAGWEVDLFGANRRSAEAALYGLDAAQEELRATLLTMIGDIGTTYINVRNYQARIALARRTAATQRETAAITRAKFDVGTASGVDLANANGQAANTEAGIPTLETALAQAIHQLSVLTGQPPAALAAELRKAGPVPSPRLPLPVGVPADMLLARPDVRVAERQLAQATAQIGQAEAALYPAISLTGNLATSGVRIGDLAKNSTITWSFGPSLSVPVFNAGELQAAVRAAQARRDQQFLNLRSSVLIALEEVENALVGLAQERIRYQKLTEAATNYREAARLARTLFQNGATSFIEVLDAERSQYSAEDALIQSRVNIATYYVALNKALGGGWDGAIDTSKPEVIDHNTGPHLMRAPARVKTR